MMRHIKSAVSALAVAFLVYIFTFYIDGEMGVILLAFVLFAPLVSLVFTIYARKRIIVTFDCDAYVKKGSTLKVTVTVEKKDMIPFAIVDIKPYASEVFTPLDKTYRLSMLGTGKKTFSFDVPAETGGNGEIGITSVHSAGFMGFIKLKALTPLPVPVSVGVIPEIPDIKASSQLFRSIADVVMTSDEEEENDTTLLFAANTTPGYEHREYVQGDPLKRVNWKLSTKRSKLMVRLDEAASSVQPLLILDLYRREDADVKAAVLDEEKLIAAVFGLLSVLIKQGIACNFVYRSQTGQTIDENVDNPDYPAQLLLKVLAAKVVPGRRVDISQYSEQVCACVVATTDAGDGFQAITDRIGDIENTSLLGTAVSTVNSTSLPLWYLDDDNNFKLV